MRPIRAIRILSFLTGVLVARLAYAEPRLSPAPAGPAAVVNPLQPAAPVDVAAELAQLRGALIEEVPHLIADRPRGEQEWIARTSAAIAASGLAIDRPQLVVVDRNPRVQQLRLTLARPQEEWDDLGGTKISGQVGRFDYFLTPTGVFLHTDAILDWRAEGTFNAHHVRGLGENGMRVWDFGWQHAVKGWRSARSMGRMRLLMHATDPDALARRLGRTASKGCIRIPEAMDTLLDRHGILDADYEQAAQHNPRFQAVLLPDRTPTPPSPEMRTSSSLRRRNAETDGYAPVRVFRCSTRTGVARRARLQGSCGTRVCRRAARPECRARIQTRAAGSARSRRRATAQWHPRCRDRARAPQRVRAAATAPRSLTPAPANPIPAGRSSTSTVRPLRSHGALSEQDAFRPAPVSYLSASDYSGS